MDGHHPAQTINMGQASIIPTIDSCKPSTPTVLTSKFDGSTEPSIQSTPSEDSMQGSGDQLPPQVREVVVRSTAVNTAGYSLVVPVRVKGKTLEGVVDTGADGTVINSKFIDITQFEAEPVMLKGLEPDRLIAGHLIKDVAINLGGRMYRWDLYVAPMLEIQDGVMMLMGTREIMARGMLPEVEDAGIGNPHHPLTRVIMMIRMMSPHTEEAAGITLEGIHQEGTMTGTRICLMVPLRIPNYPSMMEK